jgi:hypothetical protein
MPSGIEPPIEDRRPFAESFFLNPPRETGHYFLSAERGLKKRGE